MSKLSRLAICLGLAALVSGCASAYPTQPIPGFILSDVKAPLSTNAADRGSRRGTASIKSVLGWVTTGDASIAAAADAGGISVVKHVDFHSYSVLGVYAEFTVIVYGD